jgi:L-cysteine:1D-myo-inositol 2-amino-2-deoxy-alpha-D-glucopyranoside ligase
VKPWPASEVPRLPGEGLETRLHDSVSGELRPSTGGSAKSEPATMYVCGITPYDATHIGHAATYVAFDLLQRAWRDSGRSVKYVQNVTDVDDPLLERATATGEDWRELAARETALFGEDMTALGVLPPDVFLGATETVPLVVDAVTRLLDVGAAYRVGDEGDVYFDVSTDPAFGGVSHLDREAMTALFGERGGDPDRPGNPRGTAPRSAPDAPAGTSSASPSRGRTCRNRSTSRAADRTSPFPTTRWVPLTPTCSPAGHPTHGPTRTPAWSASTARR